MAEAPCEADRERVDHVTKATVALLSCDSAASKRCQEALESYYAQAVLGPAGCTCALIAQCRGSAEPHCLAEAQLSYVGDRYAMTHDRHPWRIVVVSMQTGEPESPITMVRRRAQFEARFGEQFEQHNPHIRGVSLALRALSGREVGRDCDSELLETTPEPVHLLNAHALVNATLCSMIKDKKSKKGHGSDVMHRNCSQHLREALILLEPTIVHSQGRRMTDPRYPTPHRSLLEIVDEAEWHSKYVATARLGRRRFVWVALGHPAARGRSAWSHPDSKYFLQVAYPALRLARQTALKLAAG